MATNDLRLKILAVLLMSFIIILQLAVSGCVVTPTKAAIIKLTSSINSGFYTDCNLYCSEVWPDISRTDEIVYVGKCNNENLKRLAEVCGAQGMRLSGIHEIYFLNGTAEGIWSQRSFYATPYYSEEKKYNVFYLHDFNCSEEEFYLMRK